MSTCFPFRVVLNTPPPTPLSVAWLKGLEEASQHLGEAEVSANEQQNLEIGGQFENAPPPPTPFFYLPVKGIWSGRGSELVHS